MRMEEEAQASITCSLDETNYMDPLRANVVLECLIKREFQDVSAMTIIQEGLAAAEKESDLRSETLKMSQQGPLMNRSVGEGIPCGLDHIERNLGSSERDVEDVIPEKSRVRITRFYVDLNLRKAQLEYTQGPVREKEDVLFRENVVRW